MRNKLITTLLILAFVSCVCAQNRNYNRQTSGNRTRQTKTKSEQKTQKKTEQKSGQTDQKKFDPAKPKLTMEQIKDSENKVKKDFLQYRFPATIEEYLSDEKALNEIKAFRTVVPFQATVSHFELEEVTKVSRKWYQDYCALVAPFEQLALNIVNATRAKDQARYEAAVAAFVKQQEACVAYLKKPKTKLQPEQLTRIKNVNTRKRRADYAAKLKKEREALLKKQQQTASDALKK